MCNLFRLLFCHILQLSGYIQGQPSKYPSGSIFHKLYIPTLPHFVLIAKICLNHRFSTKRSANGNTNRRIHAAQVTFSTSRYTHDSLLSGENISHSHPDAKSFIARLELCRMLMRNFSSGYTTALPRRASMAMDQHIISFDARNRIFNKISRGVQNC
jgi:hypothetical protein